MNEFTSLTRYRPPERNVSEWSRYARIITERRSVALGVLLGALFLGLVLVVVQPTKYRATATLQIDPEPTNILDVQNMRSGEVEEDKYVSTLNTQMRLIRSWTVCDQTVKALGLEKNKKFNRSKGKTDLASALQSCLKVQSIRGTRLVEIHADHRDPEIAALLADGVARQYIQHNAKVRALSSAEGIGWLNQQFVVETLKELNGAMAKARADRLKAEADWIQMKAQLDAGGEPGEIPVIADRPDVMLLRQQARQKEVVIATLQRRYRTKHPAMIAAQAELAEINAKRTNAHQEAIEQTRARFNLAQANERSLLQVLQGQEETLVSPAVTASAESSGSPTTQPSSPGSVLGRLQTAGVLGIPIANNVRLIDPVQVPDEPDSPKVKYIFAVCLLVGLFGGVGTSLLLDAFDPRVRSDADVEALGVPVLSGVPRMQLSTGQSGNVLQFKPDSAYADAFRGLRASIGLKPEAKDAKTLMVTSTISGEGKTVVAANLSIAYALHGERTLLIDCDLHRPGQANIFKSDPDKGFERYLAAQLPLQEIIQPTDVANLEVICVGNGLSNSSELLASARLPDMLKDVADLYDRVVIDCPPVLSVSDPLMLLPYVNGVVFVVGSSKTHREDIERAMRKLRECNAPLMGVVMNNLDGTKQRNGYYRNGYGHEDAEPERASVVQE